MYAASSITQLGSRTAVAVFVMSHTNSESQVIVKVMMPPRKKAALLLLLDSVDSSPIRIKSPVQLRSTGGRLCAG
jgi:hypothetical protein